MGDEPAVGVVDELVKLVFAELLLLVLLLLFEQVPGDELELALLSRDDTSSSSGDCEGESEDDDEEELMEVDECGEVDDEVDVADDMVD